MIWLRRRSAKWTLAGALVVACILIAGAALLRANGAAWLWDSVEAGDVGRTRLFLITGVDINSQPTGLQGPALHVAAARGNLKLVAYLLDHGADIAAKNAIGWTALHWAAGNGHLEIAELLIDRGADVNAKNAVGNTPLALAKRRSHTQMIALLRERGGTQ